MSKPVLERAAQEFADATANPPYLFDLGPVEGRKVVDDVPSSAGRACRSPPSATRASSTTS